MLGMFLTISLEGLAGARTTPGVNALGNVGVQLRGIFPDPCQVKPFVMVNPFPSCQPAFVRSEMLVGSEFRGRAAEI